MEDSESDQSLSRCEDEAIHCTFQSARAGLTAVLPVARLARSLMVACVMPRPLKSVPDDTFVASTLLEPSRTSTVKVVLVGVVLVKSKVVQRSSELAVIAVERTVPEVEYAGTLLVRR